MILLRMFYPRKTKINIKKTKRKINKNWCWRRRDPMGIFVLVGSKCPQQRVDAIKWGPKTLRASASGGALRCLLRNTVNFSTSAPGWEALIFSLGHQNENLRFWSETIWKSMREIFIIHYSLFFLSSHRQLHAIFLVWIFDFFRSNVTFRYKNGYCLNRNQVNDEMTAYLKSSYQADHFEPKHDRVIWKKSWQNFWKLAKFSK